MKRVLVVLAVGFLLVAFGVGSASADDKRILDVLLKKGIISKQEYDQILEAKEPFQGPVVAETYKDDTPTVATEEATPGGKRPPVGSYADLETKRGVIENLRKNDYRNVWTNVDTLLKHSERLSIGLVALKVQYNADNTNRSPGTTPDPTGFAAAPVSRVRRTGGNADPFRRGEYSHHRIERRTEPRGRRRRAD